MCRQPVRQSFVPDLNLTLAKFARRPTLRRFRNDVTVDAAARRHGLDASQMNVVEIDEMLFDVGNSLTSML